MHESAYLNDIINYGDSSDDESFLSQTIHNNSAHSRRRREATYRSKGDIMQRYDMAMHAQTANHQSLMGDLRSPRDFLIRSKGSKVRNIVNEKSGNSPRVSQSDAKELRRRINRKPRDCKKNRSATVPGRSIMNQLMWWKKSGTSKKKIKGQHYDGKVFSRGYIRQRQR